MANVKLLDGAFVEHTYNNVNSVTLPAADSGTVTFYAAASPSVDFGVDVGSSLNAVYFNTQHDTTALDDYLAGEVYTQEGTFMGFNLLYDILISDSNSTPLVFIASLPAALNSAYIIYAMNGQTPVIFYSTEAFVISGLAVPQGWQMDYASLGATVTIGEIENNFVAIKDNYIARSAEAYGEWTSGALLTGESISPDFSNGDDTYSAPAGKVVRELTVNKPATLIPENIVKDVVIAGVTGIAGGGGGGKPYSFGAPTVKKNPIYNGGVLSPTLNGFFADYMTISGTTSATEVGSYTMTFSLKDTENSQWSDGSTAPKSVTWQVTAKPAAVPYIVFSSDDPFSVRFSGGKTWDGTVECSLDNSVWTTWNGEGVQASLQNDAYRLFFRGNNTTFNGSDAFHFVLSGDSISCDGAIESLINYSTVVGGGIPTIGANALQYLFYGCTNLVSAPQFYATTLSSYCYQYMFYGCTSLTSAPALPATSITQGQHCYAYMFRDCTSLTSAPTLPATKLALYCYQYMFSGCTSLTSAPALPATTLSSYCYSSMFSNCRSLTSAPALPATTLATYCYYYMFSGCTSLTSAPALSATTLQNYCYRYMFYNCTSLTSAPALPATTLKTECYSSMFSGCTSLTSAPALPATTLQNYCYSNMFTNCKSLKFSSTSTGEYIYAYRIPSSGTGSTASNWNSSMFSGTGGTYTSNPNLNTTYYTTNPPIVAS